MEIPVTPYAFASVSVAFAGSAESYEGSQAFALPKVAASTESLPKMLGFSAESENSGNSSGFTVAPPIEWDDEAKERFHCLAKKHALQDLDTNEESELRRLRHAREQAEPQFSTDDMIRQDKRRQALKKLVESFNEYVETA